MTTLPVTVDIDELEQLAKAATPGPWEVHGVFSIRKTAEPGYGGPLITRQQAIFTACDARYIAAASPDVVLALVTAYRELAADVERRVREAVAAHVRQGDTAAGRWEGSEVSLGRPCAGCDHLAHVDICTFAASLIGSPMCPCAYRGDA